MILSKKHKKSIFTDIFDKVYSKLECNIIYVFLCGGDCKNSEIHQIRDIVKSKIEEKSKNIKILYPEELFFEDDKKTLSKYFRDKDLLELETILAHNSNIVCIICKSIGSATELGAFTNYKEIDKNELLDKLVAITYSKYEADKPSFISEGPIKRLTSKEHRSRHKIYDYNDEIEDSQISKNQDKLTEDLISEFEKICKKNKKIINNRIFLQKNVSIKNFIGLAYLILLFIYFYDGISSKILKPILKDELKNLEISTVSKFEFYYPLAIRFLLNNQNYINQNSKTLDFYLTDNGSKYLKNKLLDLLNIKTSDIDYIRMRIMYNQMYKNKKKGDYIS